MIELFNDDCMAVMANYPDKYFDLAVVDPPYGIGENWRKDKNGKFYSHSNNFNNSIPTQEYFDELFRVSKNQIIWGCNYYWNYLTPTNNLIFWDKGKDAIKQHGSAGELAWTNITKYPLVSKKLIWNGAVKCEYNEQVHPHQKPIALYKWLLSKYAKAGDKILDTHGGSMSSVIACIDGGFDMVCSELDKDYFDSSVNRINKHVSQMDMFIERPDIKIYKPIMIDIYV